MTFKTFFMSTLLMLGAQALAGGPLEPLFEKYHQVQTSLAADKFEDAKAGVALLEKAVAVVRDGHFSPSVKKTWKAQAKALGAALAAGTKTKDIGALRVQFEHISNAMIALAKVTHPKGFQEYRCPMAFNNKGANWLQKEKAAANPYYGASMLRCGFPVATK